MRSLGKSSLSATTQVKVLSPETFLFALDQGFHFLETNIGSCAIGKCESDVPGSKPVAGKRIVYIGTWKNRSVPHGSIQGDEKVTRMYDVSVVGLIRSRGVVRVMPVEFQMAGGLVSVAAGRLFDKVAVDLVDAVVTRAGLQLS